MALWDKLLGELIDIVEWLDDSNDTLAYRFERYQNEIKYGARLVVREGQMAAFINEGKLADVFKPGTYELTTHNLPILTTLRGWKYGFNSPFKAEIYFVSTRKFTDLKWGTPGPAMMRDKDFGMVRVTAFGIYAVRAKDAGIIIRDLVGTDATYTSGFSGLISASNTGTGASDATFDNYFSATVVPEPAMMFEGGKAPFALS